MIHGDTTNNTLVPKFFKSGDICTKGFEPAMHA